MELAVPYRMRWVAVILACGFVVLASSASTKKEKQPEKIIEPAVGVDNNDQPPTNIEGEPNVVANEVPERDSAKLEAEAVSTDVENQKNEEPKEQPLEATKEDTIVGEAAQEIKGLKKNEEEESVKEKEKTKEEDKEDKTRNEEQEEKKEETKGEKVTYEGTQVVRVVFKTKEQKKFVKGLENNGEIEIWHGNGTAIDVVVTKKEILNELDEKKINYEVIINNLQRAIEEENPQLSEDEWNELVGRKVTSYSHRGRFLGDGTNLLRNLEKKERGYCCNNFSAYVRRQTYREPPTKKRKKTKKGHRLTWQMYHRMNDIHGYLDYLSATYPQLVTVSTIGTSVEGRPLKLVKVASGEPNRPAIWVDAGIHAREWITPASLTYIISQMVEGGDGTKGVDWYFLPIVNPDGYEHSHTSDRLWRKNRASSEKGACAGTDLNRNFGYKWGGQGASRQPCRETYAGTGPFSEPETSAINNFVMSHNSKIKGYVSLHSYGQYILYPWGYDRKVPPDYDELARVGRLMASAIAKTGGQRYTVGSAANTLYPASGGSDDWAKGIAKIQYAYTIELRDTGRYGFVLPAPYIIPAAKDAYAALDILAQEIAKK